MPTESMSPDGLPSPALSPQPSAPHPVPSAVGDISLSGEGQSQQRRWLESFGISLLPLLAIFIARVVSWKSSETWLNPVDLSFAMLSTVAVVFVQLVENSRINPKVEIIPRIIMLVSFIVVFTVTGVTDAHYQGENSDSLNSAASTASQELLSAGKFIHLNAPANESTFEIQQEISESGQALAQANAATAPTTADALAALVSTCLITLLFFFFTYRFIWSRL